MYNLKSFLLGAALVSSLSAAALMPDWANFDRYAQSNAEVKEMPAKQRRVVFLGNSITDHWAAMRPEFFTSHGFVGRGIGGQTSYQFLSRFREDVVNLHPEILVLNVATNDVAENSHVYSEERTMGNIMSMVEIAEANGIKVILTTTLPAAAFNWNPAIKDSSEKIIALNKRLAAYAKKKKIPFVDYYSALVDEDGKTLSSKYTDDGVHPTAPGYEVMEAIILPAIAAR